MTDGNSALQFNGKGDFATATGTALYQASASFTVEAWVKIDAEKRDIFPILENADIELLLAVLGSHPSMYFRGNEIHARTHLEPGVWTHVAWSYNAKTREQAIYVNGVLDFSIPGDQLEAVFSRGDIQIGRDGDEYFCGELTEIRIWDAALAQPDIQNRMHLRLAGAESGLVE